MGDEKESKHIKTRGGKKVEKWGEIVRKESESSFIPPLLLLQKRILLPTTNNMTHILKNHKTLKCAPSGHTNKYKCADPRTRKHAHARKLRSLKVMASVAISTLRVWIEPLLF